MALLNSCQSPWVCIGDFNFTSNKKETLGGNRCGESSATNFLKELIFEFGAIDLSFFVKLSHGLEEDAEAQP